MAKDKGCTVADLMRHEELRQQINLERYAGEELWTADIAGHYCWS